MTTNNNTTMIKRITHIDKSMYVDGKWTIEHTQAIQSAERVFGSFPLLEKPNVQRVKRKRRT